jgi:hypothetical protein
MLSSWYNLNCTLQQVARELIELQPLLKMLPSLDDNLSRETVAVRFTGAFGKFVDENQGRYIGYLFPRQGPYDFPRN